MFVHIFACTIITAGQEKMFVTSLNYESKRKEVYFCWVNDVNNSHLSLKEVVVRNYMFCSSKIYSFGVKNNVQNENMQGKNPLRFRKENLGHTNYLHSMFFFSWVHGVGDTSTDGKRRVFRSVTTSHGRQDMRSRYETQLWTSGWRSWLKNAWCLSSLLIVYQGLRRLEVHYI